ncbi:hypothetical protein [Duncaniella muris]|uniref:hypothetical protein n=1 Tax=Duncaniella muris TaxID=2094150 RepID=UPI003F681185
MLTPAAVTNIVFTATIYADKAATTPLDLILFSGVYYKKDQFVPYILNRLNATNQLNYWIQNRQRDRNQPDGTLNRDNYTQVSAENVDSPKTAQAPVSSSSWPTSALTLSSMHQRQHCYRSRELQL